MTPGDLLALRHLAKMVPADGIIVEVGSMFGKSAVSWATYSAASKIYCVDTFIEDYNVGHDIPDETCQQMNFPLSKITYDILKIFTENTKSFNNILPIRGYSPNEVTVPEDKIDLFFLDASHTNPNDWENIQHYLPKMKIGGIISGHDYDPIQFPDVVENVARLREMMRSDISLYQGSSVWSITVTDREELIK